MHFHALGKLVLRSTGKGTREEDKRRIIATLEHILEEEHNRNNSLLKSFLYIPQCHGHHLLVPVEADTTPIHFAYHSAVQLSIK